MNDLPLPLLIAQFEALDRSPFAHASVGYLIEEIIDRYLSWREECEGVERAYENWCQAERADRGLAFTAYGAALDREESAAATYRALTERIGSP